MTIGFILTNFLPVPAVLSIEFFMHTATVLICLWLAVHAFRKANLKDWLIGIMASISFIDNLNYFVYLFWGIYLEFFHGTIAPMVVLPSTILYLS